MPNLNSSAFVTWLILMSLIMWAGSLISFLYLVWMIKRDENWAKKTIREAWEEWKKKIE